MDSVPIGLALAAGTLAVVNPCGFALLPAYASLLVLGDQPERRTVAIGRALGFAAALTVGFVAVFGVFGLLLASVAAQIQPRLPWFTMALGIVLAVLGAWLTTGRSLPGLRLAAGRGPALTRSFTSMTMFGVAYALASLGCTIGPFLVTVVATFRTGTVTGGVAVFAAYALGMGIVVTALSLAIALAQEGILTTLRRAGRIVSRLGGLLLLVSGAYVAYYGWYEIRVQRGGAANDRVIDTGAAIQRWLATGLDDLGNAGIAAIAIIPIVITTVVRRTRRR